MEGIKIVFKQKLQLYDNGFGSELEIKAFVDIFGCFRLEFSRSSCGSFENLKFWI